MPLFKGIREILKNEIYKPLDPRSYYIVLFFGDVCQLQVHSKRYESKDTVADLRKQLRLWPSSRARKINMNVLQGLEKHGSFLRYVF